MKSALIAWGIGFGFAWMGAAVADEHRVEVLAEAPQPMRLDRKL